MSRKENHIDSKIKMEYLNQKSILELPDEVIEEIMSYLSFSDLLNLSKEGARMEDCAKRVMKNKAFSKYIFCYDSFITS